MGRGFLAGIFWGGIVGLAILFVSNLTMGRQTLSFPKPEATAVEVPAGTEFDQAREETEPVVPNAETRPSGDVTTGVVPPEDAVETPPAFDTSSLEVPTPSVEGPSGLGETPNVADGIEVNVTGPGAVGVETPDDSPALVTPDAPASAPDTATEAPEATPSAPVADDDVALLAPSATTEAPATPSAPDATQSVEQPTLAPIENEAATAPEAPATPVAPSVIELPDADDDANAIIRPDGGESEFFKPVDGITDRAPAVETDRLPRIGEAPETEESGLPSVRRLPGQDENEDAAEPSAEPDAVPDNAGALMKYRTAFENTDGRPLLSVVLVHEGDAAIAEASLAGVPSAVAFAVDAGHPNASEIARAYRAAGREVVMIPSLPVGATPQDVEVALRVNFETIPEAVAVMDNSGESFQSDRAAVAQIVDVVAASGHGLITFPRGLNTAHQRAERAGVPTGLIFRDIDGTGQTNEQIRRAMDRAAFRARQDEAVILVGRTQRETLAAMIEWALGNRAASVTLAPISAALQN